MTTAAPLGLGEPALAVIADPQSPDGVRLKPRLWVSRPKMEGNPARWSILVLRLRSWQQMPRMRWKQRRWKLFCLLSWARYGPRLAWVQQGAEDTGSVDLHLSVVPQVVVGPHLQFGHHPHNLGDPGVDLRLQWQVERYGGAKILEIPHGIQVVVCGWMVGS